MGKIFKCVTNVFTVSTIKFTYIVFLVAMSTFRSNVGVRRDGADTRQGDLIHCHSDAHHMLITGDMSAGGAPPVTINKRPATTSAWAH